MLVIRINKKKELVSAKPCKACLAAIKQAGISKVYYTDYQGNIQKINPVFIDLEDWDKEKFESKNQAELYIA